MAVIDAAKAQGVKTAVVTFAEHPAGKDVIVPEITNKHLKEKALASLGVDIIVYLDFETVRDLSPEQFIDMIASWFDVKYISCGYNYTFGKGACGDVDTLKALCDKRGIGTGCIAPVCIDGVSVSSTRIRKLIANGEVGKASVLLGRSFSFYGEIVHGRHLGHTLGIPTINQELSESQLLPKFGVYASVTHIGDKLWPSVTNVGVKPTILKNGSALSETYIQGFDGDLYGKEIQVDLIEFLRPEMKFDGLEALKQQMNRDKEKALTISKPLCK